MSYLVLARKFRPQSFSEVCGQEHVTKTLMNAIKRGKVAHAYLFAGPRGVGKTSIARIFAKALNCVSGPAVEPCLRCNNCLEIAQGVNLAVREIDGASHNSVENVRDLIESFRALPAPGSRYKIYIIDEVHMLSTAAFNALLKSLEEPPPHTVFILATTEVHKIPETVISRCQRHDFRTLPQPDIEVRLHQIAQKEGIQVEAAALSMIARLAEGSMRDAESLLERVQAFCDGPVTSAEASRVLGTVERRILFDLSQAVLDGEAQRALTLVGEIFSLGVDPSLLFKDFVAHFRDLLVARFGSSGELVRMGLSKEEQAELKKQVEGRSGAEVQFLVQLAREGADAALRSAYPRLGMEALLVRMATRESLRIEPQALAGGNSAGGGLAAGGGGSLRPAEGGASSRAAKETPLNWELFVKQVSDAGAHMLAEQLKRLSVEKFVSGCLEASGPDFSVAYLAEQAHHNKLKSFLSVFSGNESWRLTFKNGGNSVRPDSLAHREEERLRAVQRDKEEDISNHPKIKSLQKVFPGSKIENIRMRSE